MVDETVQSPSPRRTGGGARDERVPGAVALRGGDLDLVLDRVRRSTGLDLPATHAGEEFAAVLALVEAASGSA